MHSLKKKVTNLSLAIFSHKYKNIISMLPYLDMSAELEVIKLLVHLFLCILQNNSEVFRKSVSYCYYSLFSF